jgi:hypothetical protein
MTLFLKVVTVIPMPFTRLVMREALTAFCLRDDHDSYAADWSKREHNHGGEIPPGGLDYISFGNK